MVQRDTVVRYDTIRIDSPVETKYINTTDTLLVQLTDTISIHDTVFVVLNRQVKEYRDNEFYARISGYEPNLDYIEVYPKTTTITKSELVTQKLRKNVVSLGIEAGYAEKWSAPIYLTYERMLHENIGVYGKVNYDINSRNVGVYLGARIKVKW